MGSPLAGEQGSVLVAHGQCRHGSAPAPAVTLPALEVFYSTICDRDVGGISIPLTLGSIGLGPQSSSNCPDQLPNHTFVLLQK